MLTLIASVNAGSLVVNAVGNITTIYDQATINATGNVLDDHGQADLFLGQLRQRQQWAAT